LRLAVVAPGAALSEADRDDLEGRGLKLRKAASSEEAVRLVRARRTLVPLAIAAAVVVVGALLLVRPGVMGTLGIGVGTNPVPTVGSIEPEPTLMPTEFPPTL